MAKKTCPGCSEKYGPRKAKCDKCHHIFAPAEIAQEINEKYQNKKRRTSKYFEPNWKELKQGDEVIVKMRSGPFYQGEEKKIAMRYKGVFKVHKVVKDGFVGFALRKANVWGYCFIYMGDPKKGIAGLELRPHKLLCKKPLQQTQTIQN